MVWVENARITPLELVLTGEAETWTSALGQIVGPRWLHPRNVHSDRELIEVVRTGRADAVILDDDSPWDVDILRLLRMVRQMDQQLPVVVVTDQGGLTGPDGTLEFENLDPATYELGLAHPSLGTYTARLTVAAGLTSELDVRLETLP